MERYRQLYSNLEGNLGSDFLETRRDFLKQSVEDRKLMIRLRKEVREQNMSEIDSEREMKSAG